MSTIRKLNFNQMAPDLVLQDPEGGEITLARLWAKKPLLLAFTRHFGCTQCKQMLAELVAGKERIESAGLGLAIIMPAPPAETAAFARQYAPGLTCLADPQRKAYQAFGLERGNLFQTFLNPKVWAAISKARKKGWQVEIPPAGQDAMQMSGTFIISAEGRIELPYYYDHIADHPPLDLLLGGVLSTGWQAPFEGPIGPGAETRRGNNGRGK